MPYTLLGRLRWSPMAADIHEVLARSPVFQGLSAEALAAAAPR